MKLFWKIYLAVVIPAIVIGSLSTYVIATYELSGEQGHAIKENVCAGRFITGEIEKEYVESRWPFDSLNKLLKRDDFLFWWIVDEDGTIHLANDTSFIGTGAYTYFPQIKPTVGNENSILDKKRNCGVFVKYFGKGKQRSFWLGFSLKHLAKLQSKIIQMSTLLLVLTVGTLGVVVYFAVEHLTRPIKSLTEGAEIIGRGNLIHRVQIQSKDELSYLARSFNKMAEDLQTTTTSIDNLNREIIERKKVEEEREKLLYELGERVKELQCLYHLFNLTQQSSLSLDEMFQQVVNLIPPGWQYPDITCARIVFEDKEFKTDNFKTTKWKQASDITVRGEKNGFVEVCYLEEKPESDECPFLNEERDLIKVTADQLSRVIERRKAEQDMEKLNKDLESANKELGQSNKELQDFAYIVSHDLKAPLRGIMTLADWISTDYGDKLDEQGKEQIDLLLSRVDRMLNLIDGILQYSRVGRIKEQMSQVNLNEIVPDIIDMIASSESITVIVENELPVIECEKTRITQVFQNLLSNAVKYMDKPQGQIRIDCVEENGFWKFSVADNGPGIEERHFEKIFQIFQTLSPRDEVESTGVGLTVVKKIVEMYSGRTWVESKIGEGSTFFFTLPKQKVGGKNEKPQVSIVSRR